MKCDSKRTRPKPARELKMTLMAAVCNKEEWQKTSPQVMLPKHPGKTLPSKKLMETWEGIGAPIQVWHGTDGWVNGDVMLRWLKCIRARISARDPNIKIVLIMDCFSVHTSKKTLQCCRRLGINIVLIPARMTWLLQCLDTDVFAPLKREIRRETAMREMASTSGQLRPAEHIEAIGAAIHHILVARDWSGHLQRVGAGLNMDLLRNSLKNVVKGENLNPTMPTDLDLQRALNLRGQQGNLLSRLLCCDKALPRKQVCHASDEKGTAGQSGPPSAEQVGIPPVQIGGGSSSSGPVIRAWTPEAYIPGSDHAPRARRLHPPATNIVVKEEREEIVGPAAGTRSRTKRSASCLDLTTE